MEIGLKMSHHQPYCGTSAAVAVQHEDVGASGDYDENENWHQDQMMTYHLGPVLPAVIEYHDNC